MSRYVVADLFLPNIGAGVEGGRAHLPREEPVRIGAQQGLRHRHRDHHVAIAVLGLPGTPGMDSVDELRDTLTPVRAGLRVGEPPAEVDGVDLLRGQARPRTDIERPQRVVDDEAACRAEYLGGVAGRRLRAADVDRARERRAQSEHVASTPLIENRVILWTVLTVSFALIVGAMARSRATDRARAVSAPN